MRKMTNRIWPVLGVIAGFFLSCNPTTPSDPPISHAPSAPLCGSFDPNDNTHFAIHLPSAGQVCRVGDSLILEYCTEDTGLYRPVEAFKEISVDGGLEWIRLDDYPLFPRTRAGNSWAWPIADSIEFLTSTGVVKRISLVSEQCFCMVASYENRNDNVIVGPFSIRR